jgi:hypothetical protein
MDECSLTLPESDAFAIAAGNPTASFDGEEDLPEACFVHSYLAAGREVNDVRVSLALALGELDRRGKLDLVRPLTDALGVAWIEPKDLHRPIFPDDVDLKNNTDKAPVTVTG